MEVVIFGGILLLDKETIPLGAVVERISVSVEIVLVYALCVVGM